MSTFNFTIETAVNRSISTRAKAVIEAETIFNNEGVVSIESTDGFSTRFYNDGFLVGRILNHNGERYFQAYDGRDEFADGEPVFTTLARIPAEVAEVVG
jgi:hypothetical protein